MNIKALQALIIGQWVVLIAAIVAGYIGEKSLPDMLIFYVTEQEHADPTAAELLIGSVSLFFILLYFISSIGLFLLKKWGRGLYLNANIGMFILVPFFGPLVIPATSYALDGLHSMLIGLTIGVLYFSNIKEVFEVEGTP